MARCCHSGYLLDPSVRSQVDQEDYEAPLI